VKIICEKSISSIIVILTLFISTSSFADLGPISFTEEESGYIKTKNTVKVCVDPDWMPFEKVNKDGDYIGIASEYIKLFSSKMDIDFVLTRTNTYPQSKEYLKSGRCDIIASDVATDLVKKSFLTTNPYLIMPRAFAIHADTKGFQDFSQLALNGKIAVVTTTPAESILKNIYPSIEIISFESPSEALKSVATKQVLAFVGAMPSISYDIQKNGLSDVYIGGALKSEVKLSVLVNKNQPQLVPILNKVIEAISEQKKLEILSKWVKVTYSKKADYMLLLKGMSIAVLIILILIFHYQKQRKLKKQIRIEKDRFQMLFEKSGNGLALLKNNQFIDCNEVAVKMMGYDSKDDLMKCPAFLSPKYQPDGQSSIEKAKKMIDACLHDGGNVFEWVHQKQDGSDFWVEVVLTKLEYEGEPIIYVSLHDISSQKQLFADNEKSKDDAIKANLAKSEFLTSMSHELRTPLNAILGFGQLLESDSDAPLSEDQKESVNYIISSGNHLLTLINDVLELSAIEAGQLKLSIENIPLSNVIADSLSLLHPIATKANIKLQLESDSALTVTADNMKLKQVLINLISNAIKYNKPNGSVTVQYAPTDHNTVKITVTDTGIGISEDKMEQVFGAFNRLGQETSNIEGTGIGLVVTKDLIEMMSGTIGFDSIAGQGSTFWVEMPLRKES